MYHHGEGEEGEESCGCPPQGVAEKGAQQDEKGEGGCARGARNAQRPSKDRRRNSKVSERKLRELAGQIPQRAHYRVEKDEICRREKNAG